MFFILGIIFLSLGFNKWVELGFKECYEFLILGSILFIPGSYHTFVTWMACRKVDGYTFD